MLWYGLRRGPELRRMLNRQNRGWSLTAVGGLTGNYLLYIWGLDHVNPGAAQILIQVAPLLLLVASVFVFKESFTGRQWLGVLHQADVTPTPGAERVVHSLMLH